jgi:PAS domain S-box-containing protein
MRWNIPMKDQSKTKQVLIQELASLREKNAELQQSESDRKLAEEALQERDIQFKKLSFWVPGMIYQFTKRPDGTYYVPFATEAIKDIFGCSPQDVQEDFSPIARVILPEDFDKVVGSIEFSAKHLTNWTCEYRVQIPGRSVRWILGFSTPEKLADGGITWYGFNTDITERKEVEEELRESETRFRTMANSIPHLAWIARADGAITWYNQRWYDYTGTTPEQMEGWGWQSIHDPTVLPEVMERWKTAIATGEPFDMEFPLLGADKIFRPFLTRIQPLKNEQGRVIQWFGTSTDLSERKQAEEELALNEREFRLLAESMPQIVWTTRVDGLNTYFNQRWVDYTGLTLEESYGHGWNKPFHPDDQQRSWDAWQNAVLHNSPYLLQCRLRRADGVYRWWLIHGVPVLDENGNIIKWYGTCTDINDLKQAEEALRESEGFITKAFRSIPDALVISRLEDGKIVEVNDSWHMVFGYSREEVIGKNSLALNLFADSADRQRAMVLLREQGFVRDFELQIRQKSGALRTAILSLELQKTQGEQYLLSVVQDVTERKQAEEALCVSEERFRRLSEAAFEAIAIHEEGVLLNANDQFFKMFGYEPGEVLGKQVMPMTVDPEAREFMRKQIATGGLGPYESIGLRKDGTRFPIEIRARQIEYKGRYVRIGAIVDITERKRAEEELRTSHLQLRALARRLQQIREDERAIIAREIHDEMGGGLTGLKMDLVWLSRKIDDADSGEERVALMDKIHTSNVLIDQMIHRVRRISTDLRPSVLDDLGLIAALEWQLSEFTKRTEITHEFTTTCEYVNVKKDTAIAVFRIFQEALTNAARYSDATKVAVVLRESERSLFGEESLVLEIRDNGRGITEEEIMNQDSLGLLGMKERVLAFNGEISICGETGGGTTLILKIPLIQEEPS